MSPNVADTLQYRHIRNTALGYVTATAPTSTEPQFVGGKDILTSYKGYLEKRPGFDVGLEPAHTAFAGTIKRTMGWRRWGGSFFIMLCEITAVSGALSNVYKLELGVDNAFTLIFSSAASEPFDFVVSNNFCFFGNGTDMKKFDGTTVTNWGIAIGSITTGTSAYCGTGADFGGAHPWANPTRIQGAPDSSYTTVTLTSGSAPSTILSNNLNATNYGFGIPIANTIVGIVVTISGFQSTVLTGSNHSGVNIFLQFNGSRIGLLRGGDLPTIAGTISFGSSSDTWGASLTPAMINSSSFGLQLQSICTNAVGSPKTVTYSLDAAQITIYALGGPAVAVNGSAGTFSASNGGYQYVFCYTNTSTGHVSSPTLASAVTGNFTNKLGVDVTLVASTDPQVTGIRLFRSTDGGGGIFFEVAGSPYQNFNGTVTDATADKDLSIITAPTFGFNDPPPPQKGFVWFANRIWGFKDSTVYFTDWEELNIGVAEEASVSGPAGNFWKFDSEVTGLSVAQDGVIIFTAGSIYKIDGDSLDTFRRTTIAKGVGCRNRATITRLGGVTAFLANTNSIWTTDSTSMTEISQWIQPDLDGIDHSQASMTFHVQGQYRWLLLFDPSHSNTKVFDVNQQEWMPPWSIVATACTSAETSEGNWTLLVGGTNKQMGQMTPGTYLDFGATYDSNLITNQIPIVEEHLATGNPVIDLYYPQKPGHISYIEYFGVDMDITGSSDLNFVGYVLDDDPNQAAFTNVIANSVDAPLKTQGTFILNKWYYDRKPTGRRASLKMGWQAGATNFKLYTFTMAYRIYR